MNYHRYTTRDTATINYWFGAQAPNGLECGIFGIHREYNYLIMVGSQHDQSLLCLNYHYNAGVNNQGILIAGQWDALTSSREHGIFKFMINETTYFDRGSHLCTDNDSLQYRSSRCLNYHFGSPNGYYRQSGTDVYLGACCYEFRWDGNGARFLPANGTSRLCKFFGCEWMNNYYGGSTHGYSLGLDLMCGDTSVNQSTFYNYLLRFIGSPC